MDGSYNVSEMQYQQLLKTLEDERLSHVMTKQKLMETTEKLDFAEGQIEALQKQIAREKRQFEQAFGALKSRATKESLKASNAGTSQVNNSTTVTNASEFDKQSKSVPVDNRDKIPTRDTTRQITSSKNGIQLSVTTRNGEMLTTKRASTESNRKSDGVHCVSATHQKGGNSRRVHDPEVAKLVGRLQQQRVRQQKQLDELTIEQQQQQYFNNVMKT